MKYSIELLDVIHLFYDAAIDRGKWPHALDALRNYLNFDRISIVGYKGGTSSYQVFYDSVEGNKFWEEYDQYYKYSNPINDYLKKGGNIEVLYDYLYTTEAEMARSEYFNWLNKHNAGYFLGARLALLGDGVVVAVAMRRARHRGHATDDEINALCLARKHIGRALTASHNLSSGGHPIASLRTLLDVSVVGIAMISVGGDITRKNDAFDDLIRLHDDLDIRSGALHISQHHLQQEFEQKLRHVVDSRRDDAVLQSRQMMFRAKSNDIFTGIHLRPIPKGAGFELSTEDAVILLAHSSRNFSPAALQEFAANFHLTAAEVNLLRSLLKGYSLDEHAEHYTISIGTVRWHMQNILQKTQTRNQTQLMTNHLGNAVFSEADGLLPDIFTETGSLWELCDNSNYGCIDHTHSVRPGLCRNG